VYSKNQAAVLSVVISCAAYVFAVQGQGGISVRILDYAPGCRWSWVSAARTIEKYVSMFCSLDWRGGAPPIAFAGLPWGGIDPTTLSADLPASKERAEDNLLVLDDAQYLAKENTFR
jgi:hypothetical protein